MSMNWNISRRAMLRGTGAALALPLLDVMKPAGATAASTPPRRMVSLFHPNGVYPASWDCQGEGADYTLSETLQPLQPLKQDVSILSGLDNTGGKGHVGATSGFLTGLEMEGRVLGISMDQQIAQYIGGQTRFPSIVLGTEPPRQGGAGNLPISYANTVSWSSPTTRVSPEINPRVAFDRMFRTSEDSQRESQQRLSVVDLVLEDARRLKGRASRNDSHKIEEYLQSVRTVEKQIDNQLNPLPRSWNPPNQPELIRPDAGIPTERDVHVKLMLDLTLLALQTDTTRVATFMMAHGFSRCNFTFLGVDGDHHTISHHKNQASWTDSYTKVTQWYVSQLAYLLKGMKAVDEGGSSLLDNSIVLYGSGLKDGNGHKRSDLPLVLAGHGGGSLKPGRRIVFAPGTPMPNLHLSLMRRFGIQQETFGAGNGTLENL
jgi:hypothetical protein